MELQSEFPRQFHAHTENEPNDMLWQQSERAKIKDFRS